MRKKLAGALSVTMAVGAMVVAQVTLNLSNASAAASAPYSWGNVRLDAGGFVDGIVFNPAEKNLIYARTDIGGAYRWNQSRPELDPAAGLGGQGQLGLERRAQHRHRPGRHHRVYAAVGMYTNCWDPNNGAILRSSDQGNTWQAPTLPFKNGGNMPGRGMGERLAVDPQQQQRRLLRRRGRQRACGAAPTTARPGPRSPPSRTPATTSRTRRHQRLPEQTRARVGDLRQGQRYGRRPATTASTSAWRTRRTRSTAPPTAAPPGSGSPASPPATWPTRAWSMAGTLYIATSDTGGPYDGGYRRGLEVPDTATGAWTNITPPTPGGGSNWYGYSGLTIDRQKPGTLMVATQISWWPDAIFFRSTDGGATWTRIWDFGTATRAVPTATPWTSSVARGWTSTPTRRRRSRRRSWAG